MIINNKFNFGQIVYLRTDSDQQPRMVTRMMIAPVGGIVYELSFGERVSTHFDIEISEERDALLPLQ